MRIHLLDDDTLVHDTWKLASEIEGNELKSYYTLSEFVNENVPITEWIFVDFQLNPSLDKAHIVALIQKGYRHVIITTGSILKAKDIPSEIYQVIGKEYPLELVKKLKMPLPI